MSDHERIVDLTHKVALITDIESLSGYAIAKALVKAGAQVHGVSPHHDICSRRIKRLRRWGMAMGHVVDLRNGAAALQFAYQLNEELPRLHVLISNCRIALGSSMQNLFALASAGRVEVLGEMVLIQELLGSLRDAATTSDPARVVLVGTLFGDVEPSVDGASEGGGAQRFGAYARNVATRLKEHRVNVSIFEPGMNQKRGAGGASGRVRAASMLLEHLSSGAIA
jgi:NADP-dependent 3-hydroxy acid dehydrogenase YdfG